MMFTPDATPALFARTPFARTLTAALLVTAALPTAGALAAQTKAPPPATATGAKVTTIAKGLAYPWGMQFLPDGRVIVTERPGRIRIIAKDGSLSKPLEGAPKVVPQGQGGMLDIALAPDFATSRLVYIAYSERRGPGRNGTSVGRAKLISNAAGDRLEGFRNVFRQQPPNGGSLHFGARLAFSPDGKLFVTLGERYSGKFLAQDLKTHYGKVVRINADGTVPPDNPFAGKRDIRPHIWSSGHRNPQAAAIHPESGRLWTVEHGAQGGDEINVPASGRNYGWPVISYGREYSGAKIGVGTHNAGMEQPVYYWDPSIAPSGMAFYTADRFPQWQGNLFVGALKNRLLARLVLDGEKVVAEERLLDDLKERIRDVRQGPDGYLYVLTDNKNGRLLRVEPGK